MCVKFHSENLNPNFTPYAPQELCNYGMTITPRVHGVPIVLLLNSKAS